MRIAITGSNGQLGRALQHVLTNDDLMLVDLPEHDITDLSGITRALDDFGPEVIIHAAAMTNVDACESDPALAHRINVLGTRNVAVAALQNDAAMVCVSTDYVFPGRDEPYWEYDECAPLSAYGRTKWHGELVVRDLLQRFYITRTAWLYGNSPRNFVETVLRLADERGTLTMVTDEVGSPTYALHLARALDKLIRVPAYGIYHLVNQGTCSRCDWASEILRLAGRDDVEVIPSTNYRRTARVPNHVALRSDSAAALGIVLSPWQDALSEYMRARRDG